MPLSKLMLKPGINRENTRYTAEGGWYECDNVRFRQGTPEKIGGWQQISSERFAGVCRSLGDWSTLTDRLVGVGTHVKFYIERGSLYFDITPIDHVTDPLVDAITFAATEGETTVTVAQTGHGASVGDYVIFSDTVSLGGAITDTVLDREYEIIAPLTEDTYTIDVGVAATSSDSGDGGTDVVGSYLLPSGLEIQAPLDGWGAGGWGLGTWGNGLPTGRVMRQWSQSNFRDSLVFGPRGGALYYWDAADGVTTRAVALTSLPDGLDVPVVQNTTLVSDVSLFVLCFGVNPIGSTAIDPMFIRWSDQENIVDWRPTALNQAGGIRLSSGSEIVTALQMKQEILVWTDTALYSMQYQGATYVWGAQILSDNISIISPNAKANASGVAFWMGDDKFYVYNGQTQTLRCDLRQYVFQDLNFSQKDQIFAGTNEGFSEVWWWYPSADSDVPNRYVVYNYGEDIWYYGNMERTAWLDGGSSGKPVAAFSNRLVVHETGVDDASSGSPAAINAYISSAEIDIQDGDQFGFVWRIIPDLTFRGSTANNPTATMTLIPMKGPGSGFTSPASVAGSNSATVARTATVPIEQFTDIVYTRVRGRQLIMKIESNTVGTTWQLGAPRIDIKPDGRR